MRRAFTLIEILFVIALTGILAAIVAVSLTGSFRSARAQDVAGRIATYDRLTREYSRKFGRPGRIVFDLERGTITRATAETDADSPDNSGAALHLPSGVYLDRVVNASGTATSGRVSIRCSQDGQTPSYAIRLSDARGEAYWVMTAGLTGKTLKVRDEREVAEIFRAIVGDGAAPAAGDDAH